MPNNIGIANEECISVVIATFNAQSEIGKTLRSLKSQSYPKFRVVLIDNQSEDLTVELIRAAFPSVIVDRTCDRGIAHAWNKGINLAPTAWILFLNVGDELRMEKEGFTLWAIQKGFTDRQTGRPLQVDGIFLRQ